MLRRMINPSDGSCAFCKRPLSQEIGAGRTGCRQQHMLPPTDHFHLGLVMKLEVVYFVTMPYVLLCAAFYHLDNTVNGVYSVNVIDTQFDCKVGDGGFYEHYCYQYIGLTDLSAN